MTQRGINPARRTDIRPRTTWRRRSPSSKKTSSSSDSARPRVSVLLRVANNATPVISPRRRASAPVRQGGAPGGTPGVPLPRSRSWRTRGAQWRRPAGRPSSPPHPRRPTFVCAGTRPASAAPGRGRLHCPSPEVPDAMTVPADASLSTPPRYPVASSR